MNEQKKAPAETSAELQNNHTQYTPASATCTIINAIKPSTLTKRYQLIDGELEKTTAANLYEGELVVVGIENGQELAKLIGSLEPNQALCYGVPKNDATRVVTKAEYERQGQPAHLIPRAKDAFDWPTGGGVMLLDHDTGNGREPLTREQLFAILSEVMPEFSDAVRVWSPSSSSLIYNGDTDEQLTPLKGHHTDVIVKDAADIQRAGKVLFDRLWLAGYGYFEVSAAGYLLERTPIDSSVWQTNRLNFAAGAQCLQPLEQRRGEPLLFDGKPLDTLKALPDLTPEEQHQLDAIKQKAKAEMRDEVHATQALYMQERASELVKPDATDDEYNEALATLRRALEHKVLAGDFPIILEGGEVVTVGEMLDDPSKYHNKLTYDPLEPEYDGGRVVGKLYLIGSRPNLHSFAHGGKTYRLVRQPREIEVVQGRTHDAVQETLALLRALPDVFDYGDSLVMVHSGRAQELDKDGLTHYLGGVCQYWKWTIRNDVKIKVLLDPPEKLVKALIALRGQRALKPLDAVITAPVMMPDGYIITKAGYNERSRLLLDTSEVLPYVPSEPTADEVKQAVSDLMHPFNEFPFCESIDRAALLAALLTAIVRPVLPTAPAFAFDAPVQGSGKTLLAKCTAALATGGSFAVWPHTSGRDDEETRKRIGTALLSGERAIIWDNVLGDFNSASIAALLTSEIYTDRTLGKSHAAKLPNKALFLITGNNLSLAGDLPRRVIVSRIDPRTERPYARSFDLDPLEYVIKHRQRLVAAGLTIIRGYLCDEFHDRAEGRTASFEVWDDLVRQPVAWLDAWHCEGEYGDVMNKIDNAQQQDPEKQALSELLRALHNQFAEQPFMAKDVDKHMTVNTGMVWETSEIGECINEIMNGRKATTRSIGKILKHRLGRVADGLVLEQATSCSITKTNRFKVVEHAG